MPPITAATIATIAIEAGRSRTARTVATRVLSASAEIRLECCPRASFERFHRKSRFLKRSVCSRPPESHFRHAAVTHA
jgi:hypothetical protein